MASPVTTRRSFAKAGAWSAPMIAAISPLPTRLLFLSLSQCCVSVFLHRWL